jgi:Flp pilus assembly pilin Flp
LAINGFINLGDTASPVDPYGSLRPPRSAGSASIKEQKEMLNLVAEYSAEGAAETEDGVVAIEYVLVAAALVVALAALWTSLGATLTTNLDAIINSIT